MKEKSNSNNNSEKSEVKKPRKKILTGVVVSNKMQKTIVVRVDRILIHPKYKIKYKKSKKFMAHDEHNVCQIGDKVRIIECRPLSKRKRWRLLEIIERANPENASHAATREQSGGS